MKYTKKTNRIIAKNCITSKILVLIILTVFTALLCSCAKAEEKPVVTLSVWASPQDQELMDKITSSFAEHYSDEAEFAITVCEEDESNCKNTVMLCPEAAADVFVFADDQLPIMARSGALLPVSLDKDIIISENGGADSSAISAASWNETLYAYPLTASNGYFLYYNADYFTDEDVKSLENILTAAKKNNKKFSMEITSGWYLYSFFRAAGLDVYENEDGVTNTCEWNNKAASDGKYRGVDVLEKLIQIATDEGFLNAGQTEFVEGIQDGTIIAGVSGTWNSSVISEAFGDGYRASKLPTFEVDGDDLQMHSVAGYKLVGVSAYSKEPEWSQRLAEWITNKENQLLRFKMRGEGPSNIYAASSEKVQSNEAIAALGEQSKYGHLQIVANCYWSPAYQLGNTISSGNIENRDLQELLDEMAENASKEN